MKKVSLLNKKLVSEFGCWVGWIGTVLSLVLIFFNIPDGTKEISGILFICTLIVIYFSLYIRAIRMKKKTIIINGVNITVKEGDIFLLPGYKVIPFNEYFDTVVSDRLISLKTLNGIYLRDKCDDIEELDNKILADTILSEEKIVCANEDRMQGKNIKYKLGSLYKDGEYLLLAFSKFDHNNKAYLEAHDFMRCLIDMWREIDKIYNGYDINLPLLGSGLTRKYNMSLSEEDILESLLLTLKISGVQFRRKTNINIVIHKNDVENINFYDI